MESAEEMVPLVEFDQGLWLLFFFSIRPQVGKIAEEIHCIF